MTVTDLVCRALGEAMQTGKEATLSLSEKSWAEVLEALVRQQAADDGEEIVFFEYALADDEAEGEA